MNYKRLGEEIGLLSAELYKTLEPYYKIKPSNPDSYLTENAGFILAYVHEQDGISQEEVLIISACLAGIGTTNTLAITRTHQTICQAAQFYSKCLFAINRKKRHCQTRLYTT